MPSDPFRSWLTRNIWPVLKPAGFTCRGRMFLRVHPNGTETSVAFDRLGLLPGRHLPIEARVSAGTHTSRAWMNRGMIGTPAGRNEPYLWRWDPAPPPEMAHPMLEHLWGIDPTDPTDDRGPYIAMCLSEEWLPIAERLTDLPALEAELRKPGWALPGKVSNRSFGALAMVIAAQRDDPEIDELAAGSIERFPDHDEGTWLRDLMPRGPWQPPAEA